MDLQSLWLYTTCQSARRLTFCIQWNSVITLIAVANALTNLSSNMHGFHSKSSHSSSMRVSLVTLKEKHHVRKQTELQHFNKGIQSDIANPWTCIFFFLVLDTSKFVAHKYESPIVSIWKYNIFLVLSYNIILEILSTSFHACWLGLCRTYKAVLAYLVDSVPGCNIVEFSVDIVKQSTHLENHLRASAFWLTSKIPKCSMHFSICCSFEL